MKKAGILLCVATVLTGLPLRAQSTIGNGIFVENPSSGVSPLTYTTAAFGDFTNDGYIDLAITTGEELYIYENDPLNPGTFSERYHWYGPERQVAWADFDNDGDLDLFSNKGSGDHTWLYRNSGAPDFNLSVVGGENGVFDPAHNAQGAGWFDCNRDGWLDLFNSSGGRQSKIYINQFDESATPTDWFRDYNSGNSTSHGSQWVTRYYDGSGYESGAGDNSPNGSYSVTADINNDGRQDILYAVDQTGSRDKHRLFVWINQTQREASDPEFYEISKLVLSNPWPRSAGDSRDIRWSGVASWDADNDGDLDVLFVNTNGFAPDEARDMFFENMLGYDEVPFTESGFADKLQENTQVDFGTTINRSSGGIAVGDINNDGWQDLYIVHRLAADSIYVHKGQGTELDATTYDAFAGDNVPSKGQARGVTFGDVDNDGDLDVFLCHNGKLFLNKTNRSDRPAHVAHHDDIGQPPLGTDAEHYLDVMVSGASADSTGTTKDGIGARVYVFHMSDRSDTNTSHYNASNLVGIREIDGGSGYGSQATQVQHFGLPSSLGGGTPHLEPYAIKTVFLTGDTLWKWDVVPDSVDVRIAWDQDKDGTQNDTTYLAQTIEVSLLDVYISQIAYVEIKGEPASTTIPADTFVDYTATVYIVDERGDTVEAGAAQQNVIRWELHSPSEVENGTASITNSNGRTTRFTATEAYATYSVRAWVVNIEDETDTSEATMTVTVEPGDPHHLVVEGSGTKPTARSQLIDDNPLGTVSLGKDQTTYNRVFAILRDVHGNWIGPSNPTTWSSSDSQIASAAVGANPVQGQGEITRVAKGGNTTINATDNGTGLKGSVNVVLDNITYTALEVRAESGGRHRKITSLTMRTDQGDTTFYAYGQRSDNNEWEQVTVDWSSTGITTTPAIAGNGDSYTFAPVSISSGRIAISKSDVNAYVSVEFKAGLPDSLVIYKAEGAPANLSPYPPANLPIRDTAGQSLPLVAKIFDHNSVWLDTYENNSDSSALITWRVEEIQTDVPKPTGTLTGSGHSVSYSATEAHRQVRIIGSFRDGNASYGFSDTVLVKIDPDRPDHIVIEGEANSGQVSPNDDNELSRLTITEGMTQAQEVYAVVRDRFGNYIDQSQVTTWNSSNTSAATVSGGAASLGQGLISRVDGGTTTITATNTSLSGLTSNSDDLPVEVKNYYYTELRIMIGNASPDSLVMTTNDDTTIHVMGRRNDKQPGESGEWEIVSATWSLSQGLVISPPAQPGDSLTFSPSVPSPDTLSDSLWAGNLIRASYPEDNRTTPDTLWVDFQVGPPTSIEIERTTPVDSLIAGEPITFTLQIENDNGLVPGTWCAGADFTDILPSADYIDESALVTITRSDGSPDTVDLGSRIGELCFQDGKATVDVVLYYAPLDDSPHQITVRFGDTPLTDTSNPFVLQPGPLASLVVERFDGTAVEDTVRMTVDESVVYYTRGYDRFGNPRGNEASNWTAGGNLHDIAKPNNTYRLYYDGSSVIDKEEGPITAITADTSAGVISDRVYMVISGKGVPLNQAITRDLDGDGYLDAVELHFTKAVQLPSGNEAAGNVSVQYSMISFTSDSIAGQDSTFDSVFVLYLAEDSSAQRPQTSWQPYVSISNWEGVKSVPEKTFVCTDGAGPVVWRVLKSIKDPNDRTQDRIKVLLSEKVLGSDGKSISVEALPADLFRVYEPDGSGGYDTLHTMLDSIPNLVSIASDSVIEFDMTNGNDLLTRQLLSLKPLAGVTDKSPSTNQVHTDNRKARVELVGPPPKVLVPFPNPTRPTFRREPPGVLHARHNSQARRWVLDDKSATVLTFPLTIPGNVSERGVSCFIKVYDAVGNLVNSAVDHDLLASIPTSAASVYNVDLYWNGSNAKGMPVAAGVYRVVVYVDYESPEYEDARLQTNVGVGR